MQLVLMDVPQVLDNLEHQLRTLSNPVHPVFGQGVRHVVADVFGASVDQHLFKSILELNLGQIFRLFTSELCISPNIPISRALSSLKDSKIRELQKLTSSKTQKWFRNSYKLTSSKSCFNNCFRNSLVFVLKQQAGQRVAFLRSSRT